MQGRASGIYPTSSFQRIPVCNTLRLSRDSAPDGSLPAFAWGSCPYPTHYRLAFAFSIFLTRSPFGFPCGRLAVSLTHGRLRAYHVPRLYPGTIPAGDPGGATSAAGEPIAPAPDRLPFGASLSAALACSKITGLIRFTYIDRFHHS